MKIKTEVEKTFLIANNLFAHIPCNKSHLKVDKFAEMLMPEDVDQGFQPIVSKGDGNCLFRSGSILVCGKCSILHPYIFVIILVEIFLTAPQSFLTDFIQELIWACQLYIKEFNCLALRCLSAAKKLFVVTDGTLKSILDICLILIE